MKDKIKRLKDLYEEGKGLDLKRSKKYWRMIKDMTVEEFVNSKWQLNHMGMNIYQKILNQICRDYHWCRRLGRERRDSAID